MYGTKWENTAYYYSLKFQERKKGKGAEFKKTVAEKVTNSNGLK
jgi:hypothetical protein